MKPPPEQPRDACELAARRLRRAADTILWFVAGLAVLLAVVAGVLFVLDLIWGQG
jgi:type VI protein secretion system component VasF